jgi:hypothetical protein
MSIKTERRYELNKNNNNNNNNNYINKQIQQNNENENKNKNEKELNLIFMKIIPIEYFLDIKLLKEIKTKKTNSDKNLPLSANFNLYNINNYNKNENENENENFSEIKNPILYKNKNEKIIEEKIELISLSNKSLSANTKCNLKNENYNNDLFISTLSKKNLN